VFEDISYLKLRDLYGDCSFVVLPMHNVDYPAGITAIMEAKSRVDLTRYVEELGSILKGLE
jgi:hypothetical protein